MKNLSIIFLSLFLPFIAFAADFKTVVGDAVGVVNRMIPVVGGLIVLAFLWGIAQYVFLNSSSTDKEQSKSIIIWGLIALFVVFSVWGIVNILTSTFIQ